MHLPVQLSQALPDKGVSVYSHDRLTFTVLRTLTPAQINAGAPLIPSTVVIPGKFQLVNLLMVVSGGAITTLTDVRISDNSSTPNDVAVVAVANLTDNSKHSLQSANTTLTIANLMAGSVNGYQVRKTGGTGAGGNLNVIATFQIKGV